MKRSLVFALRGGSCRQPLGSSRVRRRSLAQRLDVTWRELRRHATIETNPEKMLRLIAEAEKQASDAVGRLNGN